MAATSRSTLHARSSTPTAGSSTEAARSNDDGFRQDPQSESVVAGAAGGVACRVQRGDSADGGGQLLGAGDLRQQRVLLRGCALVPAGHAVGTRSEEHTSELQ